MSYDLILGNKEVVRLIYTVVVGLICLIIVLKTHKLFRLSLHQGIRYFRNAFFFYGLAFIMRYLLGTIYFFINRGPVQAAIMQVVFEFFLIMAGFSLLYSLLWKKFEPGEKSFSSLFNARFIVFYAIAFVIAFLDYLWRTYAFMFVLQIILFGLASIISYLNYKKNQKRSFLKLYFVAMVLNLAAWILNFVVAMFFNWNIIGVINIQILNIVIFLLFLYGVMKVTKKSNKL
jgi:hypothetical protein